MYQKNRSNKKMENNFFNRLKKAVNILTNNDKKEIEVRKKIYNKKEIAKFKRIIRYRHIDYIIKNINQDIKNSRSRFLGMSAKDEHAMHLFTLELTKIKNNNNIKNDLEIYNYYYVKKAVLDALEYLNNRYTNLVTKVNTEEEFKRVTELKVIEELKEKLIPLSQRY